MGAVNTVRRNGDKLIGENTDGKGFLRSLSEDASCDPAGKRVTVLGAGGAARAITVELALAGVKSITVLNRTASRGQVLVDRLREKTSAETTFHHWTGTYSIPKDTDILVNATSIGLYPDVDARPDLDYATMTSNMIVSDVIPNPPRTPFLREAEKRGAKTLDGLGMLVYQGAIGFEMWTGMAAPVEAMHRALEAAFRD
jgi:shikimate dehydrogenase